MTYSIKEMFCFYRDVLPEYLSQYYKQEECFSISLPRDYFYLGTPLSDDFSSHGGWFYLGGQWRAALENRAFVGDPNMDPYPVRTYICEII